MSRSFRNPRKKALSILALLLGVMWLSQTIVSILFRQPADPQQIAIWLPLGLLVYALWHTVKVATRSPVEPFEWTGAEREFIIAAPVSRVQQITYRLSSIAMAAVAKALCFSIVMSPDIGFFVTGFVGMLLGLALVDLLRLICELGFYGLNRTGRLIFRGVVLLAAGSVGVYIVGKCLLAQNAATDLSSPAALVFFQNMFSEVIAISQSATGKWLMMPFQLFTGIALSQSFDWMLGWRLLWGLGLITTVVAVVYRLDNWMRVQERYKERSAFANRQFQGTREVQTAHQAHHNVRVPFRWQGVGSLAWRQLQSVYNYRSTVLLSMFVPIVLSCLTLLARHDSNRMLIHLVGSLIFYSFLLLPSALILDFRRDINRMAVLKSLPFHPLAVTIGQLATPVLMCCIFQALVLSIACALAKITVWQAVLGWWLMVPVNVLIFALENYIFMLAPYRRDKEGFDVFLRTILTFTGKGLLFALGAILALLWVTILSAFAKAIAISPATMTFMFVAGVWTFALGTGCLFVWGITRQFVRFDPSQDTPGAG